MKGARGRRLPLIAIGAWIAGLLIVQSASGQGPRGPRGRPPELFAGQAVAAGEVLVKLRGHPQPGQIAQEADADRDEAVGGAGARLLRSHSLDTATLIAKLSQHPDVEYVEPNFLVQAGQIVPAPTTARTASILVPRA